MKHDRSRSITTLLAAAVLCPSIALAEPPAPQSSEPAAPASVPADELLDTLTDLLTGVYSDGTRVARFFDITVEGAPRMLLCEISNAQDGSVQAHVLTQFIRRRGEPYLRMMRFPAGQSIAPGLWASDDLTPDFRPNQLDILSDMQLQLDTRTTPTRFRATTGSPIPTYTGDAIELKSELAADAEQLFIFETGYNEAGDIVWTFPEAGRSVSFKRVEEPTNIQRMDDGLVVVTIREAEPDAYTGQPGDEYEVHYTGYLANGQVFDTSRQAGRSTFTQVIPGRLAQGWNLGIPGAKVGEIRRLIVPPSLGYGARGYPGVIPPNAWLVFDVEVIDIRKPEATPEEPDAPAEPGGEGG